MKKVSIAVLSILMAVFMFVNCCAMENVKRGQKGDAVKEVQ